MKKEFTKSEILNKCGCYSEEKAKSYLGRKSVFTIQEILNLDIPLKDKAWFIRNNCELTTDQFREFAIGCALCVLPIYENKYPENKTPREAIQAAKDYRSGTISIEELRVKRHAADYAAYYAYGAAEAVSAACNAAYAASAAYYAYNAAEAVSAACNAASAAYYAADGAYGAAAAESVSYKEILLNFFKEFTK